MEYPSVDFALQEEQLTTLQTECEILKENHKFDESSQKELLFKKLEIALIAFDDKEDVVGLYAKFYEKYGKSSSKILSLSIRDIHCAISEEEESHSILSNTPKGNKNEVALLLYRHAVGEETLASILKYYRDSNTYFDLECLPLEIQQPIIKLTKNLDRILDQIEKLQN